MDPSSQRLQEFFFRLFESLPRQGPGNLACAARALGLCRELPPAPSVLDLGCGTGSQTLHLAGLTAGAIVAIDAHAPGVERLQATIIERGLSSRIRALVGDMADSGLSAGSFDLIWSEGALYNLGLRKALDICHGLLRPGGYIAFTEPIWLKENPPPVVRALFEKDYPSMGRADDVLAIIREAGFVLTGHFTLPDEAWWDDFYTPMEARIAEWRVRYAGDREALAILDQLAQEPAMHRQYSDQYAYAFFIARSPSA